MSNVGTSTIGYTYDANGNGLTMADGTGTTTYQYDNLDRLTQTLYPDGKTVQAAYDKAGNRTSFTNPGAIATSATYDAANRLTQLSQGMLTWTFAYDRAGNRTQLIQPNGTSTNYNYQSNNWLSSMIHQGPAGGIQNLSYTYDANGNRLSQTDSSGTSSLIYDALNRLTQATYPGYGTWSWTYDALGNRVQQVAPPATPSGTYIATLYTYDANNRLTQAGAGTYTYDSNGNLTGISAGQTFGYNAFNQLTQVTGPGGTVAYAYNGAGLKTQRTGPDGVTRYYYDGIRPIWETDGVGAMTAQLDRDIFGNLLSRREATGARRYYHPDGLGSTVALTNESGVVTASMLYDAWGNLRATGGTAPGKYQFTGAELDPTTGFYHMGARFYDSKIGRWLSEDPVQDKPFDPASLNFYAYVFNNPVLLTDPQGTDPSGPTPEGIKQAEQRLQDFINALNDLNQLIEAMKSKGITSISIAGLAFSLADLKQAAGILASEAASVVSSTTEELVRRAYMFAGITGSIGAVLWFVGMYMMKARNPLGVTLFSAGLVLLGVGAAVYAIAWVLDELLTGGAVGQKHPPLPRP